MTSRREVLQIGLTGAVLLPVATYAQTFSRSSTDDAPYRVIVDERFPDSLALAIRRFGASAPLTAVRGDVTSLWYHDLYFAWQKDPAPIAGITTPASLFCLAMLARDAGLQVTREHVVGADLVSWAIGPRTRTR